MTSTNLFRQLQREWAVLAASETARHAVARWAVTEPDLAGYADPARIVKRCARRTDPAAANRLLAAVLRVAGDDALARRTVLQALLPGIAAMSRKANKIGWCHPSSAWADLRELDHELLTLACERIRVAAGQDLQWPAVTLTAQVWRRLRIALDRHRRHRRQQLRTVPLHPDLDRYLESADFIDRGESWEEQLTRVVCEAVRDGTVAPGDGAAIFSTRILGLPSEQAADQLQVTVGALWQRRRRAERTLAKTLAAAA